MGTGKGIMIIMRVFYIASYWLRYYCMNVNFNHFGIGFLDTDDLSMSWCIVAPRPLDRHGDMDF